MQWAQCVRGGAGGEAVGDDEVGERVEDGEEEGGVGRGEDSCVKVRLAVPRLVKEESS